MKTPVLIILLLTSLQAFSQTEDEARTYRIINIRREKAGMLPLRYFSRHQDDVNLRSQKIAKTFELSDDCGECTGEVIAKGKTYKEIMVEITDQNRGWEYFKKEATGLCVSIYKTDSLYYAVVLTY
jgi:hypothetical protein